MKSKPSLISMVGMLVALAGLPPAMAQKQESASTEAPKPAQQSEVAGKYSLSSEQMDGVRGGRINLCEPDVCVHHTSGQTGGAGCSQCPVIWNNGVDGPIIIWSR